MPWFRENCCPPKSRRAPNVKSSRRAEAASLEFIEGRTTPVRSTPPYQRHLVTAAPDASSTDLHRRWWFARYLFRRAVLEPQGAGAVRRVDGVGSGLRLLPRGGCLRLRLVSHRSPPRRARARHELLARHGHVPAAPRGGHQRTWLFWMERDGERRRGLGCLLGRLLGCVNGARFEREGRPHLHRLWGKAAGEGKGVCSFNV